MTIKYAAPIPEKAHVLHVGLLVDGVICETPVRKAHYESLTAPQKLAYATECAEVHHPTDRAKAIERRAAWDADDQARANAAAEEARQAELAKLTVTPQGFVRDEAGEVVGVSVTVTHQGHTASAVIANDPASAEANALAAWQVSKDAADAEAASLAAFALAK
jgi:hypothetical protein